MEQISSALEAGKITNKAQVGVQLQQAVAAIQRVQELDWLRRAQRERAERFCANECGPAIIEAAKRGCNLVCIGVIGTTDTPSILVLRFSDGDKLFCKFLRELLEARDYKVEEEEERRWPHPSDGSTIYFTISW